MLRCVLRAKIHMATVTDSNLSYDGSITIDEKILKKSGILPYEQVMVGNLNNGERFETYVIPGKKGSGDICLNGPAARKGVAGDKIIIFCYTYIEDSKLKQFKPTVVFLDESNKIISLK
jgi:aspartate 1-decarboxylase